MISPFLFIVGLILAVLGANWLINGSAALARRLSIPDVVIGLTVVAFGTSMPELVVDIFSSLKGMSHIAIGNITGSNIFNILVTLGATALILPMRVESKMVWKGVPLCLLAALILGVCANDALIDGLAFSLLSRIDGVILLAFFVVFLFYTFGTKRLEKVDHVGDEKSLLKSSLLIILGLIALLSGGHLIVEGAVNTAEKIGISNHLIGILIIGPGTSVPELIASVVAARKGKSDMVMGNIIGSNIFNVFFILGVSSLIHPIPFNAEVHNPDVLAVIIASLLLFAFIFTGNRRKIERWEGILFLVLYALYLGYSLWI